MQITLVNIGGRARSKDPFEALVCDYLKRSAGVARCDTQAFREERGLFDWLAGQRGRTDPQVLLLDATGRRMTSEELAVWLGSRRAEGARHVIFAIGPADGWSEPVRAEWKGHHGLLSLGPMTLAHQLARLVMAEQIYRACTILTGHPYHKGH
ncbi:Ribosomal RNA large subunit methyltransferase H [Candidatus Sulfotelmatomonas gaucii]|uniref:Ribosomal RNA large subunit methyltransferase H n=1 Tax=Candidatus Sulfuritelmatomonas gaucii TaxID=2043161 RepID=A0A2N9L377_9BACT|nr:Ribosomal RNA large subunit methyltransferase H [Candidatus Sulfotelmatomonas gaucii]